MVKVIAIALSVLALSCSVALMETEDEKIDIVHNEPRCTGTKGYAAWDLLNVAVAGLSIYATSEAGAVPAVAYVVPVAAGVAYVGSAIYGFGAADKCKELRRRRDVVNSNIADRIQTLSRADLDRERAAAKARVAPAVLDAGMPAADGGDAGAPVE